MSNEYELRHKGSWAILVGHYELAVMGAFTATGIAGLLTHNHYLTLTILTGILVITWFAAIFCREFCHDPGLCERCSEATPLDPQAAVARGKPLLWLSHSVWPRGMLWLGCPFTHFFDPGSTSRLVFGFVLILPYVALVVSERKHRQLHPWCPYCDWDDGGEEEDVPEPDPLENDVPSRDS